MADAQNNQKNQQQDLNQILKVRREKLAALQDAKRKAGSFWEPAFLF